MQPFNTLGHINLKVADLERSIGFYSKIGFPEFLRLTETDGSPWIVYLRITDDLYIELLPGGVGEAGSQTATGLNHLCLTTDDIEATVASRISRWGSIAATASDTTHHRRRHPPRPTTMPFDHARSHRMSSA